MASSTLLRSEKTGLPPGTLVHVGERPAAAVRIRTFDYDAKDLEERKVEDVSELPSFVASETVTWVDVGGVHDVEIVGQIGSTLGVHPLVLEDVVNTQQRPKAEVFEDHIFVVLKMFRFDPEQRALEVEQVSLILGERYVVTFQEKPGDVFEAVRQRIRKARGRIRQAGADYLAYALIDVIVDHYFLALEGLGEEIEDLEEALISSPGPEELAAIHKLRRVLVSLRKAVWPLRESVQFLERSESELIRPSTAPYFRDVYDHTVQVIDTVETYRDVLAGYLDLYLSNMSHRMNEVMKVLTIIATIFIPLTFIAGIYGMNFEHMPELKLRWGYPAVWFLMGAVAIAMLGFFRRRKWL